MYYYFIFPLGRTVFGMYERTAKPVEDKQVMEKPKERRDHDKGRKNRKEQNRTER